MAKRTTGKFVRRPRDQYDTPAKAVEPLLPFLRRGTKFVEPCAGAGQLIDHLTAEGHVCVWAADIEPRRADVKKHDMMTIAGIGCKAVGADMVITNPPWSRSLLHPFITRLIDTGVPAWLLFDAAWAFNLRSASLREYCSDIVPIGRVQWFPGTDHQSMDDAAWYQFRPYKTQTVLHVRTK